MWQVVGVDEEHRFRGWTEAADTYRAMVRGWVDTHRPAGGDAAVITAVDGLARGESHHLVLDDPGGGTAEFRIGWESAPVGAGHFTAC